jgi:arabinofuranosyltransferase
LVGWRLLWFLTDDAYISFRYVSNSVQGDGYVWNPPPFRPVEGYTNFLWVFLLDAVWRLAGIEPPVSCNYLALGFSFLTLLIVGAMLLRVHLDQPLAGYRIPLLGIAILGIVSNRTFLTWTSSGLETAMFNFFMMAWIWISVFADPGDRRNAVLLSTAAVGTYLTRPDGLLFIAGTVAILALTAHTVPGSAAPRAMFKHMAAASPLLLVLAHIAWRRLTYHEWLPNSYYAKYTGPWPESGLRYVLAFALEYAIWMWLILLVYLGLSRRKTVPRTPKRHAPGHPHRQIAALAVGTVLAHALYYIIFIGGDHFEYRVFSHLIPLAFVSFVWMLGRVRFRPAFSIAMLGCFVLLSWPVPWTHWMITKDLATREATHMLRAPVSDHWPGPVRWYANLFDRQQAWLIGHYVCVRHQEHKVNCEFLKSVFPSRAEGSRLPATDYPVFAFPAVGVASWVLPRVNIIDLHGINDYVIARNPVVYDVRMMAHDRAAPPGYVECFQPNVEILAGRRVEVIPRPRLLAASDIAACEQRWARLIRDDTDQR